MEKIRNRKNVAKSKIRINDEYQEFSELEKHVRPRTSAIKIAAVYLTIGSLWILLSDKALETIVKSDAAFKTMQLYKGWFYVLVTALILFLIIYRTLRLYKIAVISVLKGYNELNATYEELIALNQQIDEQYQELEKQKNALLVSEQRYQIVADGSYDGIWDWDIINDVYYLSDKWKLEFGYGPSEIGNTMYAWESLFYPGEWEMTKQYMDKYLKEKTGIFESIYRIHKKTGEYRWILSRGKGVWDKNGKPIRVAGSHTDITERKNMEEKMELLAFYDTLTGLPNRFLFEKKVSNLIEQNSKFVIISMDIDDLKHINDMFGQSTGDRYIKYLADLLSDIMVGADVVARLSGDQFAIAHVIGETDDSIRKLELLFAQIRIPWNVDEEKIFVTISAGYAIFPEHSAVFATLMQKAEIAMFKQKENGKDGYTLFEPIMYEETLKISQMNTQLKLAVANEEFVLYYQPQYDLNTGKMVAAESLIRWNHPKNGLVSPMEFIPFSEKTGHIIPISIWVMKTAIMQKRAWEEMGYESLKVAINLSGHVIVDEAAMNTICTMLETLHVQPGEIEVEVTETALMIDLEKAKESLERFRAYGISIALDDFGTGYSSLTYLHTLPFDVLKMDREFIKNIKEENEDNYIYKTVIDLAHNMGQVIIAEGIEVKEQRDFLLKNNCDIGQGYYFAKPLPADEINSLLEKKII